MKNVEKLVPVAVAGLVLASAGTVDARAEDTTPAVDTNPATSEEQKQETTGSSTEIKSATKEEVPNPDGSVNSIINVDTNGDEITDDGEVTTQTTPGESSSETVNTGDPTSTTTTNPDGSTTTTTTTPTETTTTETSETEIKAEITPPEDNTPPTDEEKEKLENDLNNGFKGQEDGWKLDDVKEGDEIGGFKATGKTESEPVESENDLGQKVTETTTTVTFEKVVENTDDNKPLTDAELGVLLGAELTKTGENTYTYTKDGATVTVTVEANTGSETTTTTYSIKVSQKTTVIDDKKETGSKDDISDIIYGEGDEYSSETDAFIDDLLASGEAKDVSTEEDKANGKTVYQVKDDAQHLTYTVTETITDLTGKPSNDIILKWLGTDFKEKDGKIVTVNGEYEVNVTTTPDGKTVVRTMTVTNAHGEAGKVETDKPSPDDIDSDMRLSPAEEAAMQAVYLAIDADGINDHIAGVPEITFNEVTGIYTVKVTVDGGKVYTYTVTASTSENTQEWDAERVKVEDVHSGSTTTITGSAYVSGETVVWTESETPFNLTDGGKVSFTTGADFAVDGVSGKVESTTQNNDGSTTVVVKVGEKTYKYNFTYTNTLESLTEAEKAELLAGLGDNVAITDFNSLKKISWTVTETVPTSTESTETVEIIKDVVPDADGKYTFTDGDKTITINVNGDKTVTDGDTTYTLTIVDEAVPTASAENLETIKTILGDKYSDVVIGADGKITATYTDGDKVTEGVTVELPATYKVYTVKKTVTTTSSSTATGSATAKWDDKATPEEIAQAQEAARQSAFDRLIADIVDVIKNAGEGVDVYYGDHKLSLTADGKGIAYDGLNGLTPIVYGNKPEWFDVQNVINFADMEGDDLKDFLEDAQKNGTESKMGHLHLELLVGSSLKTEAHPEGEDCAILGDELEVWVAKDVDSLLGEDKKTDKKHQAGLSSTMDYDKQGEGFYQFAREHDDQTLTDNPKDAVWSENDKGVQTGGDYKFYKIVGKVAHDLYTGTETDADGLLKATSEKVSIDESDVQEGRRGSLYTVVDGVRYDVDKKWVQTGYPWEGHYDYSYTKVTTAEEKADAILRELNLDTAKKVKFTKDGETYYKVYKQVSTLEAYGFLDDANNECTWYQDKDQTVANARGFDLKLGNLTLVNGKVTASGANTYSYSANLTTKKSEDKGVASTGSKLGLTHKVTTPGTKDEDRNELAGSKLTGEYKVTETRTDKDLGSEKDGWKYEGGAETKYNTWTNWASAQVGDTLTSTSTRYQGSLGYDYTITGRTEVGDIAVDANSITRSASTVRNVVASLSSTSVTRTPGSTTTTTTTPAPVTPTPVTPTDDDDDPTPPTVIDEEDVPLAETPETPDVEIPDEEVPMAEEPDVEIPDEEVPLAEVPQTGDNFLLEALALAISSASGLWLGLGKKRRS